jgi:hypothetical protein
MNVYQFLLGAGLSLVYGVGPALAGPNTVSLVSQPDLAAGLAAFPTVTAPSDAATQRINRALASLDKSALGTLQSCRKQAAGSEVSAEWDRTVALTMRGPRYLALTVDEDWGCGGAHPDEDSYPLVYDLQTGGPVNWLHLLPKSLQVKATLDTADDGTPIGVVESPILQALYMKMVGPQDPSCLPPFEFTIWPDAKADGLALQPFGLAFAFQACGVEIVLPLAQARQLGVDPTLLAAIATAHTSKWYDLTSHE